MPKENRSGTVSIYNVWNVNMSPNVKSYRIRFRDDQSADGWSTAFLPKNASVKVEKMRQSGLYKIAVTDENMKVRVRRKTDNSFTESAVLIRSPYGSEEPGFKELYETSRALAKADKAAKQQAVSSDRNTQEIWDPVFPVVEPGFDLEW